MLLALSSFGSFDVVVDEAVDTPGEWSRYVSGFPGAVRMSHDGTHTVYRVPAGSMDARLGAALPIARAYAFEGDATPLADGRAETHWAAGASQSPGQWVSVDLGGVHQISGITHALGLSPYGFPRRLAIDVSIDGATWDQAWEGSTVAHAFRAAVHAPTAAVMPFAFAQRPGRFVRLRQLASHPFPWLVAEIQVHGPGD